MQTQIEAARLLVQSVMANDQGVPFKKEVPSRIFQKTVFAAGMA